MSGAGRCATSSSGGGFPVHGVRYVPHLVGEPYPHPEAAPLNYYGEVYAQMHRRDLPLIGAQVGADTLSLRPWPTEGPAVERESFFDEMSSSGMCKVIPTFHLSKFYSDMLVQGASQPRTDPSSAFAVEFERFAASVKQELLGGVEMVAWTVDLSLDLHDLLPMGVGECEYSTITEDETFSKYTLMLHALHRWVHPTGAGRNGVPALASVPFLLPLDLSRVAWSDPASRQQLSAFMRCMETSRAEGGWSELFSDPFRPASPPSSRWLLSFAEHVDQIGTYGFKDQLLNVSMELRSHSAEGFRAVVMTGAQALKRGSSNPISSVSLVEDMSANSRRYSDQYADYQAVQLETQNLDGFIYDEWMDDWDRGTRGPFFLATELLEDMKDPCTAGSRFTHDIDACSRTVGDSGVVFPEFNGLVGATSQLMQHCVHPRFGGGLFGIVDDGNMVAMVQCAYMVPHRTWMLVTGSLLTIVFLAQALRLSLKWRLRDSSSDGGRNSSGEPKAKGVPESKQPQLGYMTICPEEPIFIEAAPAWLHDDLP